MASSDATERFAASASELGIEVAVRSYPEGTRTAVDAAAAVGCDVDQIVKSLVLVVDDRPVLGVFPLTPGDLVAATAAREADVAA